MNRPHNSLIPDPEIFLMFRLYQSIPIYRTQCWPEKIYTDTNKDNADASSSSARFGKNRPEDIEVPEAGFPWWIVKLKS
jgi:hypothetical protein